MSEGNKHRRDVHNGVSESAEGFESGMDSVTTQKQYLPYDDYVKDWLVPQRLCETKRNTLNCTKMRY